MWAGGGEGIFYVGWGGNFLYDASEPCWLIGEKVHLLMSWIASISGDSNVIWRQRGQLGDEVIYRCM